jgi:lambda family phage minor tail protein L
VTVPTACIQSLSPGAIVDLWELDTTALGGSLYRFHAGTNQLGTAVVWQGNTYDPMPVQVEGVEVSGKGTLPRPTFRVANLDGTVSALIQPLDDLLGAKVTRKRTLVKYLDAVNFPGGVNATADPTQEWPNEVFYVEQKTSETRTVIEFTLVSALDLQGRKIPKRIIQATVCPWNDPAICQYSTGSQCSKTLDREGENNGCGAHFPGELPFGGFPGCARIR